MLQKGIFQGFWDIGTNPRCPSRNHHKELGCLSNITLVAIKDIRLPWLVGALNVAKFISLFREYQ